MSDDQDGGASGPVSWPRAIRFTYSVPPSLRLMQAVFGFAAFVFALQWMPATEPLPDTTADMSISVSGPETVRDAVLPTAVGV